MANVQVQRDFFNTGKTRDVGFRITQLKKLEKAIQKYENEILDAFAKWNAIRAAALIGSFAFTLYAI